MKLIRDGREVEQEVRFFAWEALDETDRIRAAFGCCAPSSR